MIKVEKFEVNPLRENSFVLSDESGECVFVDPGFFYREERREIKEYIADNKLKPIKIINTHCHFDHIMGVEFIRNEYKIPLCAHADDAFWINKASEQGQMFGFDMKPVAPIDYFLNEKETLTFGDSLLEIIHIPGHSPGHIVFYNNENNFLIAGDVLFYGSIGRSDLPGGDHETLISNIKNKLFQLPGNTKVFCGHGPETTLGFEKSTNPFLT
ncbi:MAG: MBL fold metallo-hydrolase [Prolixibacteraceae bacterium]|jgi:hydroxyacylglutathione hydrolase|nr:MBL fold metallo-hydrolase [Prolixibacteraceae bacterium]MBT6766310.1 MBL fold metallo-hydrolase [Prolixibacteraceae bacterium]MBT6999842.1 MBL fold metallo-hydrolase [Prolixibacteraceae bacterium]MBT7394285.1 MBL fold metallo-hydrolase [Prolixibacteraceae bacterium]